MFIIITTLLLVLVATISYKWRCQYWSRKNIPSIDAEFIFGNLLNGFKRPSENLGLTVKRVYDYIKGKGWPHAGVYYTLSPIYFVVDLEYLKSILGRDFEYFVDHPSYTNERDDPLNCHVVNLTGSRWWRVRTQLSSLFTPNNLKIIFETSVKVQDELRQKIEAENAKGVPIDLKDLFISFVFNSIGSSGFGIDCKSFQDEDSLFKVYGEKVFDIPYWRMVKTAVAGKIPRLARLLGIRVFPKDFTNFWMKFIGNLVKNREKDEHKRNDWLQALIDMKTAKKLLTIEEIAAQSFLLFYAGYENFSILMTFMFYELAKNTNIQKRLRKEINAILAKHNGKITNESLQEMRYMKQVIDETLRKYPPIPFNNRKCVKDYKLPDKNVIIEKGTPVIIPILGIHYDETFYPDPHTFDPDRFDSKNIDSRPSLAFMPFGYGPRSCIGMRLAYTLTKVSMVSMLQSFEFTLNEKTMEPLIMRRDRITLCTENKIWFNVRKL